MLDYSSDIQRTKENQQYKFLLNNLDYIVIKPTNITTKITAFIPFKSKNICLNKTDSFDGTDRAYCSWVKIRLQTEISILGCLEVHYNSS
jgi:hypothetical protein